MCVGRRPAGAKVRPGIVYRVTDGGDDAVRFRGSTATFTYWQTIHHALTRTTYKTFQEDKGDKSDPGPQRSFNGTFAIPQTAKNLHGLIWALANSEYTPC